MRLAAVGFGDTSSSPSHGAPGASHPALATHYLLTVRPLQLQVNPTHQFPDIPLNLYSMSGIMPHGLEN